MRIHGVDVVLINIKVAQTRKIRKLRLYVSGGEFTREGKSVPYKSKSSMLDFYPNENSSALSMLVYTIQNQGISPDLWISVPYSLGVPLCLMWIQ